MSDSVFDIKYNRGELSKSLKLVYELIQLLGWPIVNQLLEKYGGESIYLPVHTSLDRIYRNTEIVKQKNAGWSLQEIAKFHKLTTRRVRQILNGE